MTRTCFVAARAWLCVCASGCLGPDLADSSASDSQQILVEAFDWQGRSAPLDALPRRPRVALWTGPGLEVGPDAVLWLPHGDDEALRSDLKARPLRGEHAARRVPAQVQQGTGHLLVVPSQPLEPGARYTLAIARWARSSAAPAWWDAALPWLVSLHTSRESDAGAQLLDTWPADGASGVPADIETLALRFDGEVHALDGVWLERLADGSRVSTRTSGIACDELGWADGVCIRLAPACRLARGEAYALHVTPALRDGRDAPISPGQARFTTAIGRDAVAPRPNALTCHFDEQSSPVGCLRLDDGRMVLRVAFDEPVQLWLEAAPHRGTAVAHRGEAVLRLTGLSPDTPYAASLRARDAAGNARTWSIEARTAPPLPTLGISEVRADPLGAEPEQEYVELLNYGDRPVRLVDLWLADAPDAGGQPIDDGGLLHPGARALIVPDGFDPQDPSDPAPPPGVALIRVEGSLGSGGLSNRGEPLFLRDTHGRRISAAPARPAPRPGVCIVRRSVDMREGGEGSFVYHPALGCTPGAAAEVAAPPDHDPAFPPGCDRSPAGDDRDGAVPQ